VVKIKILVAGGLGFIGSNFIRHLMNQDPEIKIVNLDKMTYAANPDNLKDVEKNPNYEFVKGDICDLKLVEKIVNDNVDAIINFAAETHVDRSIMSAGLFITSNIFGTYNLLEVARKNDVKRFIQIGTDEVYGSISEGSFDEAAKLNPSSPYAASKAGADMLSTSFFQTYGIPVVIARSTNNFGPYQHPEKFIPKMIINAISGNELPVYGRGNNVRDWLFVEDNCRGIYLLVTNGKPGEIYNIAGENEKQNIEIAKMIIKNLGKSEDLIKFVKDRPGHDFRYSLSCKKIKNLGWEHSKSFEECLKSTIVWYQTNDWWWKKILASTDIDFHKNF